MAEKIEIDFEWPVAARYEIVESDKTAPPPGRATIATQFPDESPLIVAHGPVTMRRPLESGIDWFAFLLSSLDLRQKVLRVAQQYGLLAHQSKEGDSEHFSRWQVLIDQLRTMAELNPAWGATIARMEVGLRPRPLAGGHVLWIKPPDLRNAIMLQAAQIIAGGGAVKSCGTCGEPFVAGGESGKRADAAFCSDTCRHRSNNLKKTAAPPKPKRKAAQPGHLSGGRTVPVRNAAGKKKPRR